MTDSQSEAHRLRSIVTSKQPLRGLCEEKLITREACDWLKFALDPFHDFELPDLKGYPDVSTEPSVCVKVRQSLEVSAPPGVGADDNWDCHIVLSPVDYSHNNGPGLLGCGQGTAIPQGEGGVNGRPAGCFVQPFSGYGATGRMDGLLVNSVPSVSTNGENWTYTPGHCPPTGAAGYELQGLHLDNYLDFEETDLGVYRILYSGFEVVNTTAQIYKQGAVTVYEYGNSNETAVAWRDSVGATPGDVTDNPRPCTFFRTPPNTIAEAKIMPGSHTWQAQDGCYNTAKFQSDNPFQGITGRNFIFCQNVPKGPLAAGMNQPASTAQGAGSFGSPGMSAQSSSACAATHLSRMSTTGAYFTGLSGRSTLFITWKIGIERLPSACKPTFLALAQPSASFDPSALVLYNLVANALPPGCPQGYNDAGKWFKWITERVQDAIPRIYPVVRTAAMLAGAMGRPGISRALGGLSDLLEKPAKALAIARLQKQGRSMQPRKKATQNFGAPGAPGGTRTQRFSQMSKR